MKKTIALLLAVLILFLCACSKNDTTDETTKTNNETTVSDALTTGSNTSTTKKDSQSTPDYVSEWGSDLIPADFPAPPASTYDVTVMDIPAEDKLSGACFDITRLIFTCPEHEFYNFSNALIQHGFYGGMKNIKNGTVYSDGFAGGWKNEEYIVVIIANEYEDNGNLKICLDISENISAFPEALKPYFPEFAFPAHTGGTYIGYNSDDDQTNIFTGKFEHIYWQWHFRFDNAFTGVSINDFNKYIDALEDAGFNGEMSNDTVDGCTVINANIYKDDYAILLTYNQVLRRLDVIYTNHAAYFFGEEETE